MLRKDDYKPGNPEYDYWNDKNLYPSLRNDGGDLRPAQSTDIGEGKIGFGTVFATFFMWILIFVPFALFCTWEDWIVQIVFWGGMVVIIVIFVISIYNAIQEEKHKK